MLYLYEILIRFDENGLKGCHVKDMHEGVNPVTGKPVFLEGPARPVTIEEVGRYLGEANAAALETLTAREKALADDRAALEQEKAEFDERRAKLASAAASVMSAV